jgi:opacity protein-like surface antigen
MKKFLLSALAVCAFSVAAQAQEASRVDIYGGYSYMNARADNFQRLTLNNDDSLNTNGFNVGGTFWLNGFLGVTADYNFHTKTENSLIPTNLGGRNGETRFRFNTFQAGPSVRLRVGRLTPFAHVLVGSTRVSSRPRITGATPPGATLLANPENDDTTVSTAIGGGLDINILSSGKIAVRAGRLDYVYVNGLNNLRLDNQQNLRFTTGVVVRF